MCVHHLAAEKLLHDEETEIEVFCRIEVPYVTQIVFYITKLVK